MQRGDVLLFEAAAGERSEDAADVGNTVHHPVIGDGEVAQRAAVELLDLQRSLGILLDACAQGSNTSACR